MKDKDLPPLPPIDESLEYWMVELIYKNGVHHFEAFGNDFDAAKRYKDSHRYECKDSKIWDMMKQDRKNSLCH